MVNRQLMHYDASGINDGRTTTGNLCYDLAVVIVRLGLLGGSSVFEGPLRDVHNVKYQWLKQVSDLRRSEQSDTSGNRAMIQ